MTVSLWWRLSAAAGAGALAAGCAVALLAVSGFLLARASQHPDIAALSVAVVAVRGLSLGRAMFRYGERLASHDVAFRVLAKARVAIWRRLEALAPAGLPEFHSGDLLARLISDVDSTQDLYIRAITPALAAGLVGAGAVLACLALIGGAGGAVLAAGLIAGGLIVPLTCLAAVRNAARRTAPARGKFAGEVADLLSGAADLCVYGGVEFAVARASLSSKELGGLARRDAMAAGLSKGLPVLIAGLTVWGVLLAGVNAVGSGAIDRVPFAAATLTALAAFEVVGVLPGAAIALTHARTSAARIGAVMKAPEPVADPPHPDPLPAGPLTVTLRDAQVRYLPGGPFALDGVSLELTPGRTVALVGPNGAGKSTVASVLLRFVDLASGSFLINGRAAGDFLADDVRKAIGGCPQDPHLFHASIAENLRVASPGASDAELDAVLSRVGLAPWVGSLPSGARTVVGENGAAVSGGQRQRIALARTLLADPQVVVLDEPTAQLDADARGPLMADIFRALARRAVLLITHDLEGLDQVDEIIALDRGRVLLRVYGQGVTVWQPYSSGATSRMVSVNCHR